MKIDTNNEQALVLAAYSIGVNVGMNAALSTRPMETTARAADTLTALAVVRLLQDLPADRSISDVVNRIMEIVR